MNNWKAQGTLNLIDHGQTWASLRLTVAWGLWLMVMVGVVVGLIGNTPVRFRVLTTQVLFDAGSREQVRLLSGVALAFELGLILAFVVIGFWLVRQKPEDWWVVGCAAFISALGYDQSYIAEVDGQISLLKVFVNAAVIIIWFLFPTGRFVPRWTRLPAAAWILATVYWYVRPEAWMNPLYADVAARVPIPMFVMITGLSLLGLWSQVYRYRRAPARERQQTKWILVGFSAIFTAGCLMYLPAFAPASADPMGVLVRTPVIALLAVAWPLSIAFAVLHYRLWDVDIIINRALVYTILIALLLALYILVVTLLSAVMRFWFLTDATLVVSLVATAAVTIAFQPLRTRIQRGINRLMFGERDEPYTVMRTLSRDLEQATDIQGALPSLARRIARSLKLSGVAVIMHQEAAPAVLAAFPEPFDAADETAPRTRLPLRHQHEVVGELVLGTRANEEALTPQDLRLLNDITPVLGVAVHNLRLTLVLQQTLERVVLAREEERRRIRNDLHDDLGPKLATLRLRIDNAGRAIRRDPAAADALLADLTVMTQDAIADVRHIIRGLRPPELEELGLRHAIEASLQQHQEMSFVVDAPVPLPKLPAAVESAAYRIVQEAVTNAVRHSGAQTCTIRIMPTSDALHLTVQDDGQGFAAAAANGIGLHSMRERAEILGGRLHVDAAPGRGTVITVQLPVRAAVAGEEHAP